MARFEDGEDFTGSFLEHFGVKGMRWGRRQDKGNSAVGSGDSGSGGHHSEDFSRTADIAVRAKGHGIQSLSNKELRDLVDRINLEQNFKRISAPDAKKASPIKTGVNYVSKKLGKTADMTVDALLKTAINIKVTEELKKKMATPAKVG